MADPDYTTRYRQLRMERGEHGVLEVALHTDGGPLVFNLDSYRELVDAFTRIARDREVAAVILTGTGDAFIGGANLGDPAVSATPRGFDEYLSYGTQIATRLMEIEAPVIAALNGPVLIHTELPLVCDVVLASETASFRDSGHIPNGIAPTDGAHVIWEEVLGPVRARYFLWTAQTLDAAEALRLGAVNEVLPAADLLPRARALASQLAQLPILTRRYSRRALTQHLRRRFAEAIHMGFALEGITVMDAARRAGTAMEPTHPSPDAGGRIVAIAELRAAPGRGDELAREIRALIDATVAEDGPLLYTAARAGDDPERFVVYEEWPSMEVMTAHMSSRITAFLRDHGALIAGHIALPTDIPATVGTPV